MKNKYIKGYFSLFTFSKDQNHKQSRSKGLPIQKSQGLDQNPEKNAYHRDISAYEQ